MISAHCFDQHAGWMRISVTVTVPGLDHHAEQMEISVTVTVRRFDQIEAAWMMVQMTMSVHCPVWTDPGGAGAALSASSRCVGWRRLDQTRTLNDGEDRLLEWSEALMAVLSIRSLNGHLHLPEVQVVAHAGASVQCRRFQR